MNGTTRRRFAAAVPLLAATRHQAMAQAGSADATRGLPRTYAGTTLRLTWANTPSYQEVGKFCTAFTDATGIQLDFVQMLQADRYQKLILDVTSKTNAFDVYITAYQWKDEVAPYVIDVTHLDQEVKGVPPMEWDDYPKAALDAYARYGDKYIAIPIIGDASMLVWNKRARAQAGLDPNGVPAAFSRQMVAVFG